MLTPNKEAEVIELCRRISAAFHDHNCGIVLVSLCNVIARVQLTGHGLQPGLHEELCSSLVHQLSDVLIANKKVLHGLQHRQAST